MYSRISSRPPSTMPRPGRTTISCPAVVMGDLPPHRPSSTSRNCRRSKSSSIGSRRNKPGKHQVDRDADSDVPIGQCIVMAKEVRLLTPMTSENNHQSEIPLVSAVCLLHCLPASFIALPSSRVHILADHFYCATALKNINKK